MIRLEPGWEEGAPIPPTRIPGEPPPVELLVPVHNEWHVLRPCLEALDAFGTYPSAAITVLDDGSDPFVRDRIAAWAERAGPYPKRVLRNEPALGFVQNANRGFRERRTGDVVLLNSDTLVTPGWLERLVEAVHDDPRIACVMPMSNQCSFHSLEVPMGWNVFQYAADVTRRIRRTGFDLVTAGGFCLYLRGAALDDVGLFDEAFGRGYGEESDWCMRARSRGWRVAGVESVFVYHRGKATFKDYKQQTFREGNYRLFMERWGAEYSRAIDAYHRTDAIRPLREAYTRMSGAAAPPVLSALVDRMRMGGPVYAAAEARRYIRDQGGVRHFNRIVRERGLLRRGAGIHPLPRGRQSSHRPRVVYVLEKFSVSGGVLSVVQLVNRLTLLGWDAKIATHHDHDQSLMPHYMLYHGPYVFPTADAMVALFPRTDVVVATLWSTARKVQRIVEGSRGRVVPWYFVQDDETGFFDAWDVEGRRTVLESYGLIPNKIVKTDWLGELLAERGHGSHKVPLGMDLDLFYDEDPGRPRPPRVLGMARPRTPRRGFQALIEIMGRVKRARPDAEMALYGCPNLGDYDLDFDHVDLGVVPHDRLRRVYNEARILMDTSSFQGFGRMGLEAMACGCATVLTRFGGINEYARDERNCLMIDPADREAGAAAVLRLLDDDDLHARLVADGRATARRYGCDAEARATSILFARSLGIPVDERTGAVGPAAVARAPLPAAVLAGARTPHGASDAQARTS